jgi:hypothetical protein
MIAQRPSGAAVALTVLAAACIGAAPVAAQDAPVDGKMALEQAEKLAANLRQGMTVEEVQKLLGKPQQTSLKSGGDAPDPVSKGTMQWVYLWGGSANHSALRVEFAAQRLEALEPYRVSSWQWLTR